MNQIISYQLYDNSHKIESLQNFEIIIISDPFNQTVQLSMFRQEDWQSCTNKSFYLRAQVGVYMEQNKSQEFVVILSKYITFKRT